MERLLKEEIPGVSVVTNPTKARKGTFEVRCGGKAIASFVSMPRPFKALREADLEKIAKDAAKAEAAAAGGAGRAAGRRVRQGTALATAKVEGK